jgi:hypothetical protein
MKTIGKKKAYSVIFCGAPPKNPRHSVYGEFYPEDIAKVGKLDKGKSG